MSDGEDIKKRLKAFSDAGKSYVDYVTWKGADAFLVDGIRDLKLLRDVVELNRNYKNLPFAFNQIAGGKTPPGIFDL